MSTNNTPIKLADRMYSSVVYTLNNATPGVIPGQQNMAEHDRAVRRKETEPPAASDTFGAAGQNTDQQEQLRATSPPPPQEFTATLHELAKDLILKEQQVELLISSLPGIGTSEREQKERMRELEAQLREVEVERLEAIKEKERLLAMVDEVIVKVRRV